MINSLIEHLVMAFCPFFLVLLFSTWAIILIFSKRFLPFLFFCFLFFFLLLPSSSSSMFPILITFSFVNFSAFVGLPFLIFSLPFSLFFFSFLLPFIYEKKEPAPSLFLLFLPTLTDSVFLFFAVIFLVASVVCLSCQL